MDIAGIGTEIVECLRIRRMIEEHGEQFLLRVFSEQEVRHCQARRHATEHFAALWAGKEAVLKSLSSAGGNGAWLDMEIDHGDGGNPLVNLRGALRERTESLGIRRVLLTWSYCRAYATASAIAMRDELPF